MNTLNEMPSTDNEKPWEKLPERIYPIRHLSELAGIMALLAFLSIFWIVPMFVFEFMDKGISDVLSNYKLAGFYVVWYAAIGLMTYRIVSRLVKSVSARNRFQRDHAQATARILRRRVTKYSDSDGTTYFYFLQVEFKPIMASLNIDNYQQFEVEADKALYESLLEKDTVNVTYALKDPRIFIFEGE